MRPTLTIAPEDSIERSLQELQRNGVPLLPVVEHGRLVGVIDEQRLVQAAAESIDLQASCRSILSEAQTIQPYATGSEALRRFDDFQNHTLVVVDDLGHVMGVLCPSDLFPRRRVLQRPHMVGGMATPFGVYLTNGSLKGGVGHWAIMATGALMFLVLAACIVVTHPLVGLVDRLPLPEYLRIALAQIIPYAAFMVGLRLLPLSGTHGAEHMVVHAMERGEALTPEVVSRMPRVHPRCGTNIAVAMFMFLSIELIPWGPSESTRWLVAAILTLFSWRPLGSLVQQYLTTKKPNAAQLRSGIKAGNELIQKFSTAHASTANIPVRIWNSGMLQVIAGSSLAILALKGVMLLFQLDLPGLDNLGF